jgi:hypothetical protein
MDSRTLGEVLTEPRPDECPLCYVERMLDAFSCDSSLRWTRRWRDRVRPRAADLERRLEVAGVFCDGQVIARPSAIVPALRREFPHRRQR